jgi:hypothetical protein
MKKIIGMLFLLVAAFAHAQTADEIINKHIAAIGGKDAWKKVNSLVMEGALNVQGAEISVTIRQLHMKGQRQDISFGGMTGFVINTPTEGWMFLPFQGQQKPEPQPAELVKEESDGLDVQGNLIDYKEKGHSVEYLGTEDVEGTECHKLKVNRKNSGEQTLFLDPDSYFIIRSVTKSKAMGQEMDVRTDFSDYRDVSSVKIPFSISTPNGPINIKSAKVNEPIDESIFKPEVK